MRHKPAILCAPAVLPLLSSLLVVQGLFVTPSQAGPVSQSDRHRLENTEASGSGGSFASSSKHRLRGSQGESFQGQAPSSALTSPTFKAETGFIVTATASARKKGISPGQLDITTLYAKTAPLGTEITPKSWQRDVDPIFVWEAPSPGLDIAGYSYALDAALDETIDTSGTSWNVAQDPLKKLADGVHTFTVKAINTAGKSGNPISLELWVDTTPPTIQTYTPQPGVLLNTRQPSITAQLTEPHSGINPVDIRLTVNGSSASVSFDEATGQLSAPGSGLVREGSNRIELRVTDRVGNAQTPLIWSFTTDTIPPTGSVLINADASMTTSVYVTLNLDASDAISGITRVLISNDPVIGYVEEPYVSLRELWRLNAVRGLQTVYVKFADGAGNVSQPVSDAIDLGLLAPDTILLSGPAGLTPQRNATFSFSCPEGDCIFSYAFDHSAWSEWMTETSATQAELPFGNHYFKVKAAKEVNGFPGIQPDEEDPTPAERTWVVGVEAPQLLIPRGPPIKLWRIE